MNHEVPKSDTNDLIHAAGRAALGAIPFVGQTAIEVMTLIVKPSLEQRHDDWCEGLAEDFRKIKDQLQKLIDDPCSYEQFVDAILQASQSAIRTSQQEKIEALKNAVLNSALNPLEKHEQHMFLRWTDEFTAWHIKVLLFAKEPSKNLTERQIGNYTMGSTSRILEDSVPELRGKRELYDSIWAELYRNRLVNMEFLGGITSGMVGKTTTKQGDKFLKFISSPFNEDQEGEV